MIPKCGAKPPELLESEVIRHEVSGFDFDSRFYFVVPILELFK